ncbi:hypothetical protein TNCV_1863331 [Trichonephila clavipes]|nr:hypothetical protein TNCV_1863331 [Trichonephila clavipes]
MNKSNNESEGETELDDVLDDVTDDECNEPLMLSNKESSYGGVKRQLCEMEPHDEIMLCRLQWSPYPYTGICGLNLDDHS